MRKDAIAILALCASFSAALGQDGNAPPRRAVALCIGVAAVNPDHYRTNEFVSIPACESDATDISAMLAGRGYEAKVLLSSQATREAVRAELEELTKLNNGDIAVVFFSGHGSQVPDKNNDERDRKDEAWCLYDGMLLDDTIEGIFSRVSNGVRIVVLSDSCTSETMTKFIGEWTLDSVAKMTGNENLQELFSDSAVQEFDTLYETRLNDAMRRVIERNPSSMKGASENILAGSTAKEVSLEALNNFKNNPADEAPNLVALPLVKELTEPDRLLAYAAKQATYDADQAAEVARDKSAEKGASVYLISAARDGTPAYGPSGSQRNSQFTAAILKICNTQAANQPYHIFFNAVREEVARRMPNQKSTRFAVGPRWKCFYLQTPFQVATPPNDPACEQ
jgi:hypothetical protein